MTQNQPVWMTYPDGVADIKFHRFDGEVVIIKRVKFDSISASGANIRSIAAEFENGDLFHVPECAWWEVSFD